MARRRKTSPAMRPAALTGAVLAMVEIMDRIVRGMEEQREAQRRQKARLDFLLVAATAPDDYQPNTLH